KKGENLKDMKRASRRLSSNRPAPAKLREAPLRVAVLIESSRAYGRGLLLGVAKYVPEFSHWQVYSHERELQSTLPGWFGRWDGDGRAHRGDGDGQGYSQIGCASRGSAEHRQ